MKPKLTEVALMKRNRVTEKTYPNSQTLKEGIEMTSRMRSVAFKALLVGLASLMLVFAGSSNATLAGGDPPPPGFILVLVQGQAKLCTDGKAVQGAKVILFSKKNHQLKVETTTNAEGKFSATAILFGAHVQEALSDLGVEFPGFTIGKMASLVISLPFVGIFISIDVCLQPVIPPVIPCRCTSLTVATGQPRIEKWLRAIEVVGGRAWIQYEVYLPVTYTITCQGRRPPASCQGAIGVAATSVFTGQQPSPYQMKLWDTQLRCQGPCPGTNTRTRWVHYSFVVEARQNAGVPLHTELPFTATITFTLTPVGCPGAAAQAVVNIVQPNPNPPPPPPVSLPIPLPIVPNIQRDPYVAQLETITPVSNGAMVSVRVGNNGTLPARVRLNVALTLEDGTTAVGVLDNLVLPGNLEFSVQVFVPMASPPANGSVWPALRGFVAEIVPYDPDDDLSNNRIEGP
jgi:hypothetical protein